MKDKESFKNEEFIVNMDLYLLRDELKKTALTKSSMDIAMNTKITSFLGSLTISGFDKNFVMKILTKLIQGIGLDDQDDKDKIEFYKSFVNCSY